MKIGKRMYTILMSGLMLVSQINPNIVMAEEQLQEEPITEVEVETEVQEETPVPEEVKEETVLLEEEPQEEKEPVYYCGLEEHIHTKEECYETIYVLDCKEEHEHTIDCYKEIEFLVCQKEEHTHNDECLKEITLVEEEKPEEEPKETYCGKEEHTHDYNCYELTEEKVLNCTEDHEHTEECYLPVSKLTCELEEHTHSEECYIQPEEEDIEWLEEEVIMPDIIETEERKPIALHRAPLKADPVSPLEIRTFTTQFFYGAEKQENGDYVWTAPSSAIGHRFSYRINYAISGQFDLEPNSIEMRIPKSILVDRNGNSADTYEMSIPSKKEVDDGEEIDMDINYAYYEDGDDIVFYNFRNVYTGENGYIELSYFTSKSTYEYYDYGHESAGSKDFFATIKVTGNGREVTAESEHHKVYINTGVEIQSVDKRFPTLFREWQPGWGEEPQDAWNYYYLVWEIRTTVRPDNQPYHLIIEDYDLSSGEIYALRGSGDYQYIKVEDLPDGKLTVTNEIDTGQRVDYVLTRHSRQWWAEQGDHIEVTNHVRATVDPIDQIDPDTTSQSAKTYVYNTPVFIHPIGRYDSFKRSDRCHIPTELYYMQVNGGRYSRYDLERLMEGEVEYLDNIDYIVWMEGYPGFQTVLDPLEYDNPYVYWEVPVRYELYDYIFYLYDEKDGIVNPNEGLDDETYGIPIQEYIDNRLTYKDFQIDSLGFGTRGYNDANFIDSTKTFEKKPVTFNEDDELIFYALFGEQNTPNDWIEVGRYNLKTKEKTFDETYVSDITDNKVFFKDNCVGYKVETFSKHYHTRVDLAPNIRLKNSERVMEFLKTHNGGVDAIGILNSETANFYPYDAENDNYDTRFVTRSEASSDYLRKSVRNSFISKSITATSNLVRKRRYTINWSVHMRETYTTGSGQSEFVEQESGTFYDLLPPGSVLNEQSIAIRSSDSYLDDGDFDYEIVNDYNGTGRSLLIVHMNVPGDNYSLYYETYHSWDSIKDWGNDIYNPVAYETGNHTLSPFNDAGEREARPNTVRNQFNDIIETSDINKFIFADTEFDIDILTAAAANLHKKVRDVTDADFSYDTWTTSNSDYYYRWRYQNTLDTRAKDLIFFDTLENYPEEQEDGSYRTSDWRGTLQFVDVSHARSLGIEPVIYFSAVPNLDLEENHDLTDASVWTEASQFGDIKNAKAVAVDLRKDSNGEDFVLGNNESVQIVLRMKAPKSARRNDGYPEAYNNIYLENTTIDNEGGSAHFYIHQDYTVIRFIVTGDFKMKKVNEEDPNQAVPKIKFRLIGKSDYGNQINIEKETDRNGNISFEKVEMGSYILQEYEANDDWLIDYTEHRVVIDEEGVVTIDGEVYTENDTLVLTNKPRIHGDLFLQKRREGTSAEEAEIIENILANGVGYVFELNGEQKEVAKIVGKYAYLRDPFPKFEYPSFENAGPDIASGIAKAHPNHPDQRVAWRITSDGELIIGTEGETQYLPACYNFSADHVYPWQENANVKAVRFVGNVVAPSGVNFMFRGLSNCTHIDLTNLDSSAITNFYWVFTGVRANVNFRNSNLSRLSSLYQFHLSSPYIDFSQNEFSLTDFSYALYETSSIEYIDLSGASDEFLNNEVDMTLNNSRNIKKIYVSDEWKTPFGKGFVEDGGYIYRYEKFPLIVKPVTPIPNTTFKLSGMSDYGNEVLMVDITDEDGNIEFKNIEKGTYELREIKENEEYILNETVWKVVVDENGIVKTIEPTDESNRDRLYQVDKSGVSDIVYNEPRYWDFDIQKVDWDNTNITLEGAVLRLVGTSDLGTKYDLEATTDANGYAHFEHIEKGTYILKETLPPTNVDENGKKGGNISYNYDLNEYVIKIDYKGILSSRDLKIVDYNVLQLKNKKTENGKITITKKWIDSTEKNRKTPKIHLSTVEPDLRYEYIHVSLPISIVPSNITEFLIRENQAVVVLEDEEGNTIDTSDSSRWTYDANGTPQYSFRVPKDLGKKYYVKQTEAIGKTFWYSPDRVEVVERRAVVNNEYRPSVFETGPNVNASLERLADNSTRNINRIIRSSEKPADEIQKEIISTSSSLLPIYAWYGDYEIYYWSESEDLYLNGNASRMFSNMINLDNPDIADLITKYTSNFTSFFQECNNLKTSNISGWDFSNAYQLTRFFNNCSSLESIEELASCDTSKVRQMDYLFAGCSSLKEVDFSPINTDGGANTYLTGLFENCTSLEHINFGKRRMPGINRNGNFSGMFRNCVNLKEVDLSMVETDSYESTRYTMYQTFYNCPELKSVKLPLGIRIGNLSKTFYGDSKLEEISFGRDGQIFGAMDYAFYNCSSLTNIDLSGMYLSSMEVGTGLFENCTNLENIYVSNNFYIYSSCDTTDMFKNASKLPNYDPNVVDRSKATYEDGGYFTYKEKAAIVIDKVTKTAFNFGSLFDSFASFLSPKTVYAEEDDVIVTSTNDNGAISLGDGNYEWISDDNKWVKNGDIWTYTFDVFDDSIKYYLYEEDMEGYLSDAMNEYIIINDPNITKSAVITNIRENEYSNLTIKKELEKGNIYEKNTIIEKKYSHTPNINDDGTQNGNYPDYLATNEVITIPGADKLHVKVVYETEPSYDKLSIWEGNLPSASPYNNYIFTYENGEYIYIYPIASQLSGYSKNIWEGDIQGDSVTFTFYSDGSVNSYGYYAVVEAVSEERIPVGEVETIPESEYDREFEFTIKLNGSGLEGNHVFSDVLFVDGVGKVKLKAGETITIRNLPKDYTYEVIETPTEMYEIEYDDSNQGSLKEIDTTPVHVRKISKTPNIDDEGVKNGLYPGYAYEKEVIEIPFAKQLNVTLTHTFKSAFNDDYGCMFVGEGSSYNAGNCSSSYTGRLLGDDYQDPANTKHYVVDGNIVTFAYRSGWRSFTRSDSYGYYAIVEAEYYPEYSSDAEVVTTNYYSQRKQEPVDITLKKEESGYYNTSGSYEFSILLNHLLPDTTYSLSNGDTYKSNAVGEALLEVTLKGGEEVKLLDLPIGTTYQVIEKAGDYYSNYHIKDSGNINRIVRTDNGNVSKNRTLNTEVETADEGEEIEITFINTLDRTNNLYLRKSIRGESTDQAFKFKIVLQDLKPNTAYYSSIGKLIADEEGIIEREVLIKDGEVVEFYNLTVGATYRIEELESSRKDYTTYIIDTKYGTRTDTSVISGTISDSEQTDITFVNEDATEISGTKTWVDDGLEHNNEEEVVLKLIRIDTNGNEEAVNDFEVVWDGESYRISDLKKFDNEGNPYTYRVEEEPVKQYTNQVNYNEETNEYHIVNTKEKGKLTIQKTVSNGDENKLFNFLVTLKNENGEPLNGTFSDIVFENGVGKVSLKHNETKTIETYVGVTYSVEEERDEEYVITYDAYREGTISKEEIRTVITNEQKPKGSLTISKEISGDVDVNETFTFEITLDDTSVNETFSDVVFKNGKATIQLKANESKTIEGLPAGVSYEVIEKDAKDYSVSYINNIGKIEDDTTSIATIKNHKEPEQVEFEVIKKWEDSNNKANKRPNAITVYLYANGKEYQRVNLTEQNGWKYTFKNLPMQKDNKAIEYSVKEKEVAGYRSKVEGNVITNTYIEPTPSPTPTPKPPVKPTPPPKVETPNTGDNTQLGLYVVLLLGALGVILISRKKLKEE